MRICTNQQKEYICRAVNRNNASYCRKCGKSLRNNSLILQDPGTEIAHYRIIRVIGHGGFGAVYEAEDIERKHGPVALKETFDPDNVESFAREFDILRALSHDNLPHYYESFEYKGNGYIVMEFIPGQSLQKVVTGSKGPVLEKLVLFYADQLCDVLRYLHRQNPPIFHRDIKPANIRLTPEGLIKLVDFGLLKQGTQQTRSTIRGLGTPLYEPFEQFGRGRTDQRSDIYSLGATLYHLLTAKRPPAVFERVTETHDPLMHPDEVNSKVSSHVSRAVVKAMSLMQRDRQPDVITFKRELMGIDVPVSQQQPKTTQPLLTSGTMPVMTPGALSFNSMSTLTSILESTKYGQSPESSLPVQLTDWRRELSRRTEEFGLVESYWCYVRPGVYLIGGWNKGEVTTRVTLSEFWIARFPISVAQFARFSDDGGYSPDGKHWWSKEGWQWKVQKNRKSPGHWQDRHFNAENKPVVGVSWYEAAAFAAWLNEQFTNDLPARYSVRLPTEAEWEAAQTYDATMQRCYYPWGNDDPTPDHAVYEQGERGQTAPIGSCPSGAAACGAEDMSGNVWEWQCSRAFDYPDRSHWPYRDFTQGEWDVPVRGGSWWDYRTFMRCGTRDRYRPDFPAPIFGFRLVLAPQVQG